MRLFLCMLLAGCGSSGAAPPDGALPDADARDGGGICSCDGPGDCELIGGEPTCDCDPGFEALLRTRCVPVGPAIDPGHTLPVEGFGRDATGGEGGPVVMVESYANDGPGTLRAILRAASGPTVVRFPRDGTIALEGAAVLVPSNVTLDARGQDVRLTGFGLRLEDVENVVVLNLAFVDIDDPTGGDGIQIIRSRRVAILHCLFDNGGLDFVPDVPDEQVSIVFGSTDITIAWSRFRNHDKVLLIGNGDAPELDRDIRVTLHHDLFEDTGRRHPFLRAGQVDMYDCIVRDWRTQLEGFGAYGSRSDAGGELSIEAGLYSQQDSAQRFAVVSLDSMGRIRLTDTVLAQPFLIAVEREPERVFTRPYPATVHAMSDRLIAAMESGAGNTMPAP